ncbi:MAG TPA: iron-containing alcohol dehydrogenase, partial [Gaiellaceae bacterium]|nr:iron-containing alcohol dehydrogenase [Gaiellaceae bacterium]
AQAVPAQLGAQRVGLVVDAAVAQGRPFAELRATWAGGGFEPAVEYEGRSGVEPDYDYLDEVAAHFRADPVDTIVAVGGGSTLDLGKGVGILLRNPGRGIDYRGVDLVREAGVPVFCIPTTAGSGSEATATASFIDKASQTKLGINGRNVACELAALDPELLVESPEAVTIGSGLDALVHAVEAVTAISATVVSCTLGIEAARLLIDALPRAVDDPHDVEARRDTLLGAHLAGLALQNAGGGPASGISYPLGVHYGVPHGFAGGVLLPHVVHANVAAGYAGYEPLGQDLADSLFSLYETIGAPLELSGFGVTRADVPRLVELTLAERAQNLELNPIPFGAAEVTTLLQAATKEN